MSSLMNADEVPLCTVCGLPEPGHENMRHPYSDPQNPIGASQIFRKQSKEPVEQSDQGTSGDLVTDHLSGLPYDPVLRLALFNKGIIGYEDVKVAEDEIRAASNLLIGVYGNESNPNES